MLDGHKLALQLSRQRKALSASGGGGGGGGAAGGGDAGGAAGAPGKKGRKEEGSTKLVVRNVAFEATRKVRACGAAE